MTEFAVLSFADQVLPLSHDDSTILRALFEERHYKRHATLLHEGEVAHEVFFVAKGALRQCFQNEDGVERTCNLVLENEFLTDLESFSRQARSATSIVALEHSTCLVATCMGVAQAVRQSKGIAEFFRIVVERIAEEGIRRTKSMLSYTPDRQFEMLAANKPEWLQRVPQRYIAQYLGIAPESLSRIRKRLLEEAKS